MKQLITEPTRINENTSTLLDHILTNVKDKTSQAGVIDVGLSDHQLIFCTRKVVKNKFGIHKSIKTRSMKHYTQATFIEELEKTKFPDYSQFDDVHLAYLSLFGYSFICYRKNCSYKDSENKKP